MDVVWKAELASRTCTKIRNGNVSLADERELFTDEPAEGEEILKLDNGKTLIQVYRY